jgi:hypothetical protein
MHLRVTRIASRCNAGQERLAKKKPNRRPCMALPRPPCQHALSCRLYIDIYTTYGTHCDLD